jgi:hypothetical protein
MLLRVLLSLFFIAHGLVHAAIWAPKNDPEKTPFDASHSWLLGGRDFCRGHTRRSVRSRHQVRGPYQRDLKTRNSVDKCAAGQIDNCSGHGSSAI